MSGLIRRPRYADVVGTLALVVAMSGTAYAAHALPKNSVGSSQVKKTAIRSAEIKNGKVKTADLAPGAIGGAQVADGSLSLADIVGVDIPVSVSVVVNGDTCQTLDLTVPGAEVGQTALLVPGATTISAVFAPARVSAPGVVTTRVCAIGIGSVFVNTPFRVVTLG
jgi:hypothetical protein